jgi:hypothetical protein
VALLAGNLVLADPLASRSAGKALFQPRDSLIAAFTRSPDFVPGATYRLLQASGNRVGMYDLLRAGARLDSEFFPESMRWEEFSGAGSYAALLARRHVDFVLDCTDFDRRFSTNEHALLETPTSGAGASGGRTVQTRLVTRTPAYSLYAVLPQPAAGKMAKPGW